MRRFAIALLVGLALIVSKPSIALAEGTDFAGSFLGGVSDTVRPDAPAVSNEETFESTVLRAGGEEETDDSPTSAIQSWILSLRLTYGSATFGPDGWYRMARSLLTGVVLPVAVLFVFFWWGLRKAVRMIFSAFRKGKVTT